jgi:hypothetical protein
MLESRTYGFVREAHSDTRPYRDLHLLAFNPADFEGEPDPAHPRFPLQKGPQENLPSQ